MGDLISELSENFSRPEGECPCGCGGDTVDHKLVEIVQGAREEFQEAITVHSGYRCVSYNKKVGGAPKSQHRSGRAWDIYPGPMRIGRKAIDRGNEKYHGLLRDMYRWLSVYMEGVGGLAIYVDRKPGRVEFIHIDTRSGGPARWEG